MLNKRKNVGNVLLFIILACTLSCTGKKEAKNADKTQSNYQAAIETQDIYSDWVLNTGLINNRQGDKENVYEVDSYNKTCSQVVKDILSIYNLQLENYWEEYWDTLENQYKEYGKKYSIVSDSINSDNRILKSVQHVKVPPLEINMNPKRTPIVFFAEYSDQYDRYNSDTSIFLLVFFEDDGIVLEFEREYIGYSMKDIPIVNSSNHIEYHWINDMPGKSFKNNSAIIRDFNGDGYEEIMLFHLNYIDGGRTCSIYEFVNDYKSLVTYKPIFEKPIYILLPDSFKEWNFGPPVQFGTYKGKEGFIIYEEVPIYEGVWNFYAWDKEEKKYVLIDRVKPDEIKTQWAKIGKSRN